MSCPVCGADRDEASAVCPSCGDGRAEVNPIVQMVDELRTALATEYDQYSNVELLTASDNGLVLRARRKAVASPTGFAEVALKAAYPAGRTTGDARKRFEREVRLTGRLNHPNVVAISELRDAGAFSYVEMPLAIGGSLGQLAAERAVPFDQVVVVMRDIGAALEHARERGVVHGALRPSRVVIDERGQCLVGGFMLEQGIVDADPALRPDRAGDPGYVAPEQRKNAPPDPRIDVYAAGLIAYELLSGRVRAMHDESGVVAIVPVDISPSVPLGADVPLYVSAVVRRAIAKDAKSRYATVAEFAEALAVPHAARSDPTLALSERGRPFAARWALLILLGVGLAAGLLASPSPRIAVMRWWNQWSGRSVSIDLAGNAAKGGAAPTTKSAQTGNRKDENRAETRRDTTKGSAPGDPSGTNRDDRGTRVSEERPREQTAKGREGTTTTLAPLRDAEPDTRGAPDSLPANIGVLLVTADVGRPAVFVNGLPRGFAPLSLRLKPGSYVIRLRGGPGYDPAEMRLSVVPQDTTRAEFTAADPTLADTSAFPR